MAELFNDIQDFKKFVGGGANVSLQMESIEPVIRSAARKYLTDWMDLPLYESLVTAYSGSPTSEEAKLIEYLQRSLAAFTMYEYSAVGKVMFTETGIHRVESETMKSAYKYQEKAYEQWMLNQGYEDKESLILFLNANLSDYPIYDASSSKSRNLASFINSAYRFRQVYSRNITRQTFEVLLALMQDMEILSILPILGDTLFALMKTEILADTLSVENVKLLPYIEDVVAYFTLKEGLKQLLVQIQGSNVMQVQLLGDQSSEEKLRPTGPALSLVIRQHDMLGNTHVNRLRAFLEANPDDYPDYTTISEEEEASQPLPVCTDRDTQIASAYFGCKKRGDNPAIVKF